MSETLSSPGVYAALTFKASIQQDLSRDEGLIHHHVRVLPGEGLFKGNFLGRHT